MTRTTYTAYEISYPWRPAFAWHPVKLGTGRWVWLTSCERRKIEWLFPGVSKIVEYEWRARSADVKREGGE